MKNMLLILALLLLFFTSGCQVFHSTNGQEIQYTKVPDYIPTSNDVVDIHGEITNITRFVEFLENTNELGKDDTIRIVSYTTEGDPMLLDMDYDGSLITATFDTRRDKFGPGYIATATCSGIVEKKYDIRIDYVLEGCDNKLTDNLVLVKWDE